MRLLARQHHLLALRTVFANPSYWIVSAGVFSSLLVLLLSAREFLFFEPYLTFHIPQEWFLHFVLIVVVAGLISLVTSLAIYQIIVIKKNSKKSGTGVLGSIIGVGAGVCTSCGPIGFSIITTFGVAGATTLSFLYEYEIPIRLIAIGVLVITYFLMVKSISTECKVKMKTEKS